MGSGQGWFESDDDYRDRVEREANESTVESSTRSAPSQGFFESDESYASRIAQEANTAIIENATGEAPSQGWLESDDDYVSRIEQEANIATSESLTGERSRQGWFEGDDSYNTRARREANEARIKQGTGKRARQGWFEGDHSYRSRINQEGNLLRRSGKKAPTSHPGGMSTGNTSQSSLYSASGTGTSASETSGGSFWVVVVCCFLCLGIGLVWNQQNTAREQRRESQLVDAKRALRARKYEEAHTKFESAIRIADGISSSRGRDVRKLRDSLYWRGTISPGDNRSYPVQGRLFVRFDNPLKCRSNPRSCGYHFTPQDNSLFYTPDRNVYAKNRRGAEKKLNPYLSVNTFTEYGVDYCCEKTQEKAREKIVIFNRGKNQATLFLIK